jgi:hypothetical protein
VKRGRIIGSTGVTSRNVFVPAISWTADSLIMATRNGVLREASSRFSAHFQIHFAGSRADE